MEYPKTPHEIKVMKITNTFSFDEHGTISPYPMVVIVINSKYIE